MRQSQILTSSSKNILDIPQQPIIRHSKRLSVIPASLDSLDSLISQIDDGQQKMKTEPRQRFRRATQLELRVQQPETNQQHFFGGIKSSTDCDQITLDQEVSSQQFISPPRRVSRIQQQKRIRPSLDIFDTDAQRSTMESIGPELLESPEKPQRRRKLRQSSIVCNYDMNDFFTMEPQKLATVTDQKLPIAQYKLVTFTDYVEDRLGQGWFDI